MNKKLLKQLSGFFVYIFLIANFIYFISNTKKYKLSPFEITTNNYKMICHQMLVPL